VVRNIRILEDYPKQINKLTRALRGMLFAKSGFVRAVRARAFPISGHIPTFRRDQWQ
jgi:hypothetical protein